MDQKQIVDEIVMLANVDRSKGGVSHRPEFFGPVAEDRIAEAEGVLGLHFSTSYRAFLLSLGAANMFGWHFPGLPNTSDFDEEQPTFLNVVDQTRMLREDWNLPHELVYITCDGGDASFFLDTTVRAPDGESPVVLYNHGVERRPIAVSFLDFIRKRSTRESLW